MVYRKPEPWPSVPILAQEFHPQRFERPLNGSLGADALIGQFRLHPRQRAHPDPGGLGNVGLAQSKRNPCSFQEVGGRAHGPNVHVE